MTNFNQLFRMPRAGDYYSAGTCQDVEDCLPIVYGYPNLRKAPLIDIANYVYCAAAHPTKYVSQSWSVYVNGVIAGEGEYLFSSENPSYNNFTTITFYEAYAPAKTDVVSVSSYGKDTSGDGTGDLIFNPIDVIDDFLTNEAGLDYTWHETEKVRARILCKSQGYQVGGALIADVNIWSLLQNIVGTFLGSVFTSVNGHLIVQFDINVLPGSQIEIISKGDIRLIRAEQRLADVVNSLTYRWRLNRATNKWGDTALEEDSDSISIYGTRSADFDFHWISQSSSGHDTIRDLILTKLAMPVWRVTFRDLTFKRYGRVDVGDYVAATFERLYGSDGQPMINQICKVVGVRPNLDKGYIEFDVLDTGSFMESAGSRDTTIY